MKVETVEKPKSADGKSAGSVKTGQTSDGTQVKAVVDENGNATVVASDGSSGKVDAQGDGEFKTATGATTKVVNGESITVRSDGTIQKNETLPPHVRMAYDILGIKASEYGKSDDMIGKNQTYEQFQTKQLKDGIITQETFDANMKRYKNLKDPTDKTGRLLAQAEEMTKPIEGEAPAEFEQRVAENYKKLVKDSSTSTASTLEKMTSYLSTQIDPNTGKIYTPQRALEKSQNLIKGGKDAQVKEIEAMIEVETDPAKIRQLEEMKDSLGVGVTEQSRQRKVKEVNTAQEYAETIPMGVAVQAYSGATSDTPTAREARRKARETENKINFSTDDKKALDEFRGDVSNFREFSRSADVIEKAVASGKYKSGMADYAGKTLASMLPKTVVDFAGLEDWYDSARADKGIDAALVNYVRQISGLTVTDTEYQRLKKILGGDYASEEARLADLKSFNQRLGDNVYDKADSLYERGYVNSVPRELALLEKATVNPQSKTNSKPPVNKGGYRFEWDGTKYVNKGKI